MEIQPIYEERELLIYRDGSRATARHPIVAESPLTIMLNGEELATMLCSPHSLELLAVGFLVGEGILQSRHDLKDIACRSEQGVVWVETTDGATRLDGFLRRNFASCCGKGRPALHFLNDYEQIQPITHMTRFAVKDLVSWATLLDKEAKIFRLTGGVHEAALAYGEGFVASYEDIGRHNALDRILGYAFLNDIDTSDKAVILSSRISSEMLTKVARMGAPIVVSRAALTCLSIDLAEQLGITLVGFARGNNLNVYTHPGRVVE
jgi:FdhD protein